MPTRQENPYVLQSNNEWCELFRRNWYLKLRFCSTGDGAGGGGCGENKVRGVSLNVNHVVYSREGFEVAYLWRSY